MAQVSKNKLPKKTWAMIWEKLLETVKVVSSDDDRGVLFRGLLTKTEQVMIAKRLMAAILIKSNWSPYEISSLLKMSTSTIYKIKDQLALDQSYDHLLYSLFPKQIPFKKNTLASEIWDLLFKDILISKSERYSRIKRND